MTKKEIVKQISDRLGLTQLKTKEIVQLTFNAIMDTLLEVGRIELRNFGVFEVKMRKARKARNPRTGERVDVEPKRVVTFKPGKEMEERVRRKGRVPGVKERQETVPVPAPAPTAPEGLAEVPVATPVPVPSAAAKPTRTRKATPAEAAR